MAANQFADVCLGSYDAVTSNFFLSFNHFFLFSYFLIFFF